MSSTEQDLDTQSRRTLTDPRLQTQVRLRDASAIREIQIDWVEPAGANRRVTFPDPTVDTEVVYTTTQQTLTNKKYTGPIAAADDLVNKGYVDAAIPTVNNATSAPGGGVKGVSTYDENFGLQVVGGASAIARVKVDNTSIIFDGTGALQATAGPGTSGLVSVGIDYTTNIPGVAPPFNGTFTGDVPALVFQKTGTPSQGTKLEWAVPDDYLNGSLEIFIVYAMSSASVSNQVRLSSQAVIVDQVNGTIDTASYPETQFNFATLTNTNISRQLFMTITAGDFAAGDTIQVRFKRFPGSGSDTHPGDLQMAVFEIRYNSSVNGRLVSQNTYVFTNAAGENPTVSGTLTGDVPMWAFPTGADSGLKFVATVPDNWDQVTDGVLRLVYAMSSAAAGATVRLQTTVQRLDTVSGTNTALGTVNYDLSPPNDTNPHRTLIVRSLPATSLNRGDVVKIMLARRVAVGGNHPGSFQLVSASVTFGVVGAAGVSAVLISEQYMTGSSYGDLSGPGVFGDLDSFDATDFEVYDRLRSTVAAGTITAYFEGRLSSAQTMVTSIRLNLKGTGATPRYRLRVYVEGTAGPVYDSGATAAPGAVTEIALTDLDLSAQPAGVQKRYVVGLQALIDNAEAVYVSKPFTRQE